MPVMFNLLHKKVFKEKDNSNFYISFTVLELLVCNKLSPVVNIYSYVKLREDGLVLYNLK